MVAISEYSVTLAIHNHIRFFGQDVSQVLLDSDLFTNTRAAGARLAALDFADSRERKLIVEELEALPRTARKEFLALEENFTGSAPYLETPQRIFECILRKSHRLLARVTQSPALKFSVETLLKATPDSMFTEAIWIDSLAYMRARVYRAKLESSVSAIYDSIRVTGSDIAEAMVNAEKIVALLKDGDAKRDLQAAILNLDVETMLSEIKD